MAAEHPGAEETAQTHLARKLYQAVRRLDLARARLLCEQGARADAFFDNDSALFLAISLERMDFLRLLLPRADPRVADFCGSTALMVAVQKELLPAVKMLLPLSDPHALDRDGASAVRWLVGHGDPHHPHRADRVEKRLAIFRLFARIDPWLLQAEQALARDPFDRELALVIAEAERHMLAAGSKPSAPAARPSRI